MRPELEKLSSSKGIRPPGLAKGSGVVSKLLTEAGAAEKEIGSSKASIFFKFRSTPGFVSRELAITTPTGAATGAATDAATGAGEGGGGGGGCGKTTPENGGAEGGSPQTLKSFELDQNPGLVSHGSAATALAGGGTEASTGAGKTICSLPTASPLPNFP
ncbi:MAG: hypothetical protein ACO3YZ_04740 [Candidatus Nanopelagicaceae bacterium]